MGFCTHSLYPTYVLVPRPSLIISGTINITHLFVPWYWQSFTIGPVTGWNNPVFLRDCPLIGKVRFSKYAWVTDFRPHSAYIRISTTIIPYRLWDNKHKSSLFAACYGESFTEVPITRRDSPVFVRDGPVIGKLRFSANLFFWAEFSPHSL